MNNLLNNEPVKRVQNALNLLRKDIKVIVLKDTAKTALDASKSLNCEIGAIVKSLVSVSYTHLTLPTTTIV